MIKDCIVKVKNKKDLKSYTNFLFKDYMNCNNFNSTHQCMPKYPPYDITNGEEMEFKVLCVSAPGSEDKLISKCSMKSTKSSDLKKVIKLIKI